MNDKGSYIFPAPKPQTEESFWPENDIFSKILSISENVITMEIKQDQPEKQAPKPLSEVEKAKTDDPINKNAHFAVGNDENLLYDKLSFWTKREYELNIDHSEAVAKVKYYKSAIKAYEKAFKKLQEIEK